MDEIIVADKEAAAVQKRFADWQGALESKGLNATETMVYAKTNEMLTIRDRTGNLLKQTETCKYPRSVKKTPRWL